MFFWKYCLFLLFAVINYIFSFVNCGTFISCKVNVPACPLKPGFLWSCRSKYDANLSRKEWFTFLMVYLFTKVSNKLLLGNHHLDTFKIFIFLPDSHEYFAHTVQTFLPFCIFGTSLDLLDSSHTSITCFFSLSFKMIFIMLPYLPLKSFRSWCMYKQSAAQNESQHHFFLWSVYISIFPYET